MKKIVYVSIFTLISVLMLRCQSKALDHSKTISNDLLDTINTHCSQTIKEKDIRYYYFDADCGLCIAQATAMEKDVNDDATIFIAFTKDLEIAKENVQRFNLESCVIWDVNRIFEKQFTLNDRGKILKDGRIIVYKN